MVAWPLTRSHSKIPCGLSGQTYTLQLFYDNPDSNWVAGIGRLYLPWAISLDTIDGGYIGRKLGRGITAGMFAGSTPNPTSWHYSPDQRIAGSFVNAEGGTYDRFHYSTTAGLALSTLQWRLDRPYLFFENSVSYNRSVSVYPRQLSTIARPDHRRNPSGSRNSRS